MQIAGNKCNACDCNVVLSSEGKVCTRCGKIVHLTCEPEARCRVCGQEWENYARPPTDPLSEAVLPRALRFAESALPILFLIAGVALIGIVLFYILEYSLGTMHDSL